MTRKDATSGELVCSFCGKSQDEVKKLIAVEPMDPRFIFVMSVLLSAMKLSRKNMSRKRKINRRSFCPNPRR